MRSIILTTLLLTNTTFLCAFDFNDISKATSTAQTSQKEASTTTQKSSSLTSLLTQKLGITDKQASGGLGSILSYAKENTSASKFSTLSSAIPNASSLLAMAPKASGAMGGLGALSGSLSGGSSVSKLTGLASQFSSLGMNSSMISQFVPIVMNYLKSSNSNGAASILSGLFKS